MNIARSISRPSFDRAALLPDLSGKIYAQVPPTVEYSPTTLRRIPKPVFDALHKWSEKPAPFVKLKRG
jgi:hypothetical protein